jgi:hypothetical protein
MKKIEEIKKFLEINELSKLELGAIQGGVTQTKLKCKCKGEGCSPCPNSKKDFKDLISA